MNSSFRLYSLGPLCLWQCLNSRLLLLSSTIWIQICHKVVEVWARREQIRGLCWQLKTNFLPVCLPSRQLMPNILRKGKHKKLSSLNRRRARKDYCYPRKHETKLYFTILSIYRWMLVQIFELLYIYRQILLAVYQQWFPCESKWKYLFQEI